LSITFVGAGAGSSAATGNLASIGMPASIANNDILLLWAVSRDNQTHSITVASGWAQVFQGASGTTTQCSLWWKRTTGTEATLPTLSRGTTTAAVAARISAFRGCTATGNPWEALSASLSGTTTTPLSTTQITDFTDGAMVCHFFGGGINTNVAPTWTNLTGAATKPQYGGSTGVPGSTNGGTSTNRIGICAAYDIDVTAGPTGAAGVSFGGGTGTRAGLLIALKHDPPPQTIPFPKRLVQIVGGSDGDPNAPTTSTGSNWFATLPNSVLRGNCLVAFASWVGFNGVVQDTTVTCTVSDNINGSWPAAITSVTDGSNLVSAVFVLPNAAPGVTRIHFTMSALCRPVQFDIMEFYGIASASPADGTGVAAALLTPDLALGSFTPGTNNDAKGGHQVLSYWICNNGPGGGSAPTAWAAGLMGTLLEADIGFTGGGQGLPHCCQVQELPTLAAIAPAITAGSGVVDSYQGLAIALKLDPLQGTPPPATIRIPHIQHATSTAYPIPKWDMQCPSMGNLIVVTLQEHSSADCTGITDNKGNTYVEVTNASATPTIYYAKNATTGHDLKLSLAMSGTPAQCSVLIYDVMYADANPFDGETEASGSTGTTGSVNDQPVITPVSLGVTIVAAGMGTGPSAGFASGAPTGAFFDCLFYTGEVDSPDYDNSDCRAHVFNTDLTTEHWNWSCDNGGINSTISGHAAHFKSAAIPTASQWSAASPIQRGREPTPLSRLRSPQAYSVPAAGGAVDLGGGIIGGASTLTGSASVAVGLAGALAGQTTIVAALSEAIALQATALAGVSALVGALTLGAPLSGTISGQSALSGTLVEAVALRANVAGQSTHTGSLSEAIGLQPAAIAGVSTLPGNLGLAEALAAAISGQSASPSAQLALAESLAAAVAGQTSLAGSLSESIALAGSTAGQSALIGNLSTASGTPLAGALAGQSALAGALSEAVALAGAVAPQATLSGSLSEAVALAAQAAGQSGLTGALGFQVPLAGSTAGAAALSAALSIGSALSAAPAGATALSGGLSLAVQLATEAGGASALSANLTVSTPSPPLAGALGGGGALVGDIPVNSGGAWLPAWYWRQPRPEVIPEEEPSIEALVFPRPAALVMRSAPGRARVAARVSSRGKAAHFAAALPKALGEARAAGLSSPVTSSSAPPLVRSGAVVPMRAIETHTFAAASVAAGHAMVGSRVPSIEATSARVRAAGAASILARVPPVRASSAPAPGTGIRGPTWEEIAKALREAELD
jgi:hypothetical protein